MHARAWRGLVPRPGSRLTRRRRRRFRPRREAPARGRSGPAGKASTKGRHAPPAHIERASAHAQARQALRQRELGALCACPLARDAAARRAANAGAWAALVSRRAAVRVACQLEHSRLAWQSFGDDLEAFEKIGPGNIVTL